MLSKNLMLARVRGMISHGISEYPDHRGPSARPGWRVACFGLLALFCLMVLILGLPAE